MEVFACLFAYLGFNSNWYLLSSPFCLWPRHWLIRALVNISQVHSSKAIFSFAIGMLNGGKKPLRSCSAPRLTAGEVCFLHEVRPRQEATSKWFRTGGNNLSWTLAHGTGLVMPRALVVHSQDAAQMLSRVLPPAGQVVEALIYCSQGKTKIKHWICLGHGTASPSKDFIAKTHTMP